MKTGKGLSLRENADAERQASSPAAGHREAVDEPGDWPWSSWRLYFLNGASLLPMDPNLDPAKG